MQSPEKQREARFRHLLQPLQDLAENWSIDVASELEDYLEELESIQISLDGGKTNLNFAEAALLIQGSACIYSKKVEYLYSLVFHTLDMVTSQKRSAGAAKSSLAATGEDADIAAQAEDGFLELDDVLQEGQGIDLVEDGEAKVGRRRLETPRERLDGLRLEATLGQESYHITSAALASNGTLLLDSGKSGLLPLSPIQATGHSPARAIATPGMLDSHIVMDAGTGIPDGDDDDDVQFDIGGPSSPFGAPEGEPKGNGNGKRNRKATGEKPKADLWAQLDPHAADTAPPKPFAKGKPPRSLANAADVAKLGPKSARPQFTLPAVSAEFEYSAHRERQRTARKRMSLAKARQSLGKPSADLLYDDGDDGDDDDSGSPFGFGDAPAGDGIDVDAFMSAGGDDFGDGGAGYQQPQAARGLEAAFQSGNVSMSYEELCKRHIEAFMKGSEDFAVETQLTKRVAEWQDKIVPFLQREEQRPEFNIFTYGNVIIQKLEELGGASAPAAKSQKSGKSTLAHLSSGGECIAQFKELTSEYEPFDICRTFLATLQLANDGNVEIGSGPADRAGLGTFQVKLLNSQRRQLNL